jgi:hypothetical protein
MLMILFLIFLDAHILKVMLMILFLIFLDAHILKVMLMIVLSPLMHINCYMPFVGQVCVRELVSVVLKQFVNTVHANPSFLLCYLESVVVECTDISALP